ncbi:outer membrane protein assembly factor BamB family protein [Aggregatilinea lenta]|uniref:outer membrane protein assembly factor BamB family protein n=1 Tax=Aggregatilinea lenta TaxID=913108 RepID=UPI0013C2EC97|nr:PQQ-binding-like beta-propeller repeat protein [Aggregatilinea lenta]
MNRNFKIGFALFVWLFSGVFIWLSWTHPALFNDCDPVDSRIGQSHERTVTSASLNLDNLWNFIDAQNITVRAMNDTVFISESQCDRVFALEARTGQVKWESRVASPGKLFLDRDRNRIYVYYSPIKGRSIVALDATSGEKLWSNTPVSIGYRGELQVLMLTDGRLFAVTAEKQGVQISPLDPDTGKKGTPIIVAPRDSFSSDYFVYDHFWQIHGGYLQAITVDNEVTWESSKNKLNPCCLQGIAVAQGKIIVGVGTDIFALDQRSGGDLWRYSGSSIAGPTVVGNAVYSLTINAELQALDINTGQQIGSRRFSPPEPSNYDTTESDDSIGASQLISDNGFIIVYFADIDLMSVYLIECFSRADAPHAAR